jgi:ribosome-binding ATPase YchF (GTP1/OBG family)
VALEVGIVGPSGSGKTSLFTALTKAGGGEYGKTNVGMAPIADERLDQLAVVVRPQVTPATCGFRTSGSV